MNCSLSVGRCVPPRSFALVNNRSTYLPYLVGAGVCLLRPMSSSVVAGLTTREAFGSRYPLLNCLEGACWKRHSTPHQEGSPGIRKRNSFLLLTRHVPGALCSSAHGIFTTSPIVLVTGPYFTQGTSLGACISLPHLIIERAQSERRSVSTLQTRKTEFQRG